MKRVNDFLNRFKNVYLGIVSFLAISTVGANYVFAEKLSGTGLKFANAFNNLSDFATKLTNGMLAFSMISGIAVLLYHIVQLAIAGNNPNERSKVLKNLLTSAICIALLGSIGLVMMFIVMYTGIG